MLIGDRRGGRRRDPARGRDRELVPGQPRARRGRRRRSDRSASRRRSAPSSPRSASTSTWRPSPTSTRTRATPSSASAPSAPTLSSSPGTWPRSCADCRRAASPRARSTFPATAPPRRTRTSSCRRSGRPRRAAEAELVPFRAAIAAGVKIDHDRPHPRPGARRRAGDDQPAHPHGLLRDELGFDGLVIDRRARDARDQRRPSASSEGAVLALAAGADALCLGHDLEERRSRRVTRRDRRRGSRRPAHRGAARGGRRPRDGGGRVVAPSQHDRSTAPSVPGGRGTRALRVEGEVAPGAAARWSSSACPSGRWRPTRCGMGSATPRGARPAQRVGSARIARRMSARSSSRLRVEPRARHP